MNNKKSYYIIGNWKMNPGSRKEAKRLFAGIRKVSQRRTQRIVACVPFVYLVDMTTSSRPKCLSIGAQNCFLENTGSHTGEISSVQLADMKVEYVILGHSERRDLGESDEMISKKIRASLDAGLKPIICIGERERDKDGEYLKFLENQLDNAFSEVSSEDLSKVIVAYEPVWAIGRSEDEAITGHSLYEIVVFIRRFLAKGYGKNVGFSVPVLYGGSVTSKNTREFLEEGNADGLLIGRQSLDPESLMDIIDIADKI